ncbi:pyridoxal phosphate-dependent decarboxylase family protein [Actinoallomurus sp. CA-150999]|uniref:pyridoxal phosphate-dependent decarboxylase family protein n=1 Tax=Actinoallomurus sp. CA-150999 TaxID=3239887 RepID=UPI003D8FA003
MTFTSPLLDAHTAELYRSLVTAGVGRVADRIASVDRPFTGIAPDRLAEEVAAVDLDRPLGDATAALDELEHLYLRDAVYFHHPRYLAHLNCPVAIPALLGEAVLSAVNSSLDTWDQSAGGTLIERRLIEWTAQRLGLGPAADGVFTSGGTQSNLQALLLAREEACARTALPLPAPEEARAGTALPLPAREEARAEAARPLPAPEEACADPARLRVFASACGHFSVVKAARLLGLGEDAVVAVPCDRDRRMRPSALARELDRCRRQGLVPMAVVATAGTTDFGSIDPLPEIAELCAAAGAWLHVDAAYGCGLLVSRRRHLLDGIERADSVTVDYHKSFFQPVSSSAVLVRDRAALRHVTYHADYLNPARSAARGIPNQVDKSLQTTRRFDALKLWLTLRMMGAGGVGELFDAVIDLAAEAWALLNADARFEVVVRPRLSTVVFRYAPPGVSAGALDRANLHAAAALSASGAAAVATTVVDGRHHLKFTLLNPRTTTGDIAAVLDLLAGHARAYLGDDLAHAS